MTGDGPTWITSNMTIEEIGKWITKHDNNDTVNAERIVRRLYEMCAEVVIK
jgi:hypothetical protein